MTDIRVQQTFHSGEVEVQTRLGAHEAVMSYAPQFIVNSMPQQHRDFYAGLPMLLVGSIDKQQRPWASAVFGRPGFLSAPNGEVLSVNTPLVFGDPLNDNLRLGAPLGFLGLEYHSRRRNRLTGKVCKLSQGSFDIEVDQAFGNCPQYIQARDFEVLDQVETMGETRDVERFTRLS